MLADYHTHTYLCKHASGRPEEYLAAAEKLGFDELGVSDHVPWPVGFDPESRMNAEEFPTYREIVRALARKSGKVKVRYALEIDYLPGRMAEVTDNLAAEELDYLIGSIHYTDAIPFDAPGSIVLWKQKENPQIIWDRYAELLLDFVRDYKFNIIGHLDIPKKFGFYPKSMEYFNTKIAEAFEIAAEKGVAIEINTAGLRKPVQEIYPSFELLKLAASKKLMLTLGSDAHSPDEIGFAFKEARELALNAGFSNFVTFERGVPLSHPL